MVSSYVPKFTYIIPFRFRSDRILPFRRVIDWLSGFQGVEIIVVEQDKHSKIDYMNLKVNHIFCKSELPFNKSWAFNVGLKRASSPTVIFADGDFLMNPTDLIECLKVASNFDCVIPTNKAVKLSPQESLMDTASILKLTNYSKKNTIFDGIAIFKKESIMKISGWNEDMIGLGFENEFQEFKTKMLLTTKEFEFTGYHLHHYPEPQIPQLLERNQQMLKAYQNEPNIVHQHISQTFGKMGQISRFAGTNP